MLIFTYITSHNGICTALSQTASCTSCMCGLQLLWSASPSHFLLTGSIVGSNSSSSKPCSRSRNPDDSLPSFRRWCMCRITTVDLLHCHRLQGSPYGWWPHHCYVSRQWINSRACPCHDIRHEHTLLYPVNKGGLYLHWGLGSSFIAVATHQVLLL